MIDIEQGKVYRLIHGGLFQATKRYDVGDLYSHWVFKRLTKGNSFEGYDDPIVFDRELDRAVMREANHQDYIEYRRRYRIEIGRLSEESNEYQEYIDHLFDAENEIGGRVD